MAPSAPTCGGVGAKRPDWSSFGEKFTRSTGISMLMQDLEEGARSGALIMGGGNPARIEAVEAELGGLAARTAALDGGRACPLVEAMATYGGPRGSIAFVDAFVGFASKELGWHLTRENVAMTNGSQSSFFYLFNLLCGAFPGGRPSKKVLLPVLPEYLGYADLGLSDDLFLAAKPRIEVFEEDRSFKYRLDVDAVRELLGSAGGSAGVGLINVSRPTNPTGNVLTDSEVAQLQALAREHGVPLLIDGAYGYPFPRIQFADDASMPRWTEDSGLIFCFSLSKLGLPGARVGLVVAPQPLAQAIVKLNSVLALAPGMCGPAVTLPLLTDEGRMARLCEEQIRPWYKRRAELAKQALLGALAEEPRVLCHRPEGCIFLWLWCRGLPVPAAEVYARLKARGVLIIPGHFFFPGLADAERWPHTRECLRISYAAIRDDDALLRGLRIVAEVVLEAYRAPAGQASSSADDAGRAKRLRSQ